MKDYSEMQWFITRTEVYEAVKYIDSLLFNLNGGQPWSNKDTLIKDFVSSNMVDDFSSIINTIYNNVEINQGYGMLLCRRYRKFIYECFQHKQLLINFDIGKYCYNFNYKITRLNNRANKELYSSYDVAKEKEEIKKEAIEIYSDLKNKKDEQNSENEKLDPELKKQIENDTINTIKILIETGIITKDELVKKPNEKL